MAGSGKGVLRIAIEDFLETFDMSNVFENVLGKFGSWMLNSVLGRYVTLLDQIADTSKMPIIQQLAATHSTSGNILEKGIVLIFMIAAIVQSFGGALAAPFAELVTYEVNKRIGASRIPIQSLMELKRRFPEIYGSMNNDAYEQGWTNERIAVMEQLATREMDIGAIVTLLFRGKITYTEYQDLIIKLGFRTDAANQAVEAYKIIPGIQDLVHFADRWAFDDNIAKRFRFDEEYPPEVEGYTGQLGLDKSWFIRYWRAHWQLPSLDTAFELLHRLRAGHVDKPFTDEDLDAYLKTTQYPPYFHDLLKAISYQPITRVDIRRLYKLKIIDAKEVEQRYLDIGYNPKDAKVLADFTVKLEDADGNVTALKYKELSFSVLLDLHDKGKLSDSEFHDRLVKAGYDEDEIKLINDYEDLRTVNTATVDYKSSFISQMTKDVQDAYSARMIDKNNATTNLQALGISDTNIAYILDKSDYDANLDDLNYTLKAIHDGYIAGAIDRTTMIGKLGELGISGTQQNKVIARMELDLQYRNRRLTEAEYRKAALGSIISWDDYTANLQALGYTDYDIDILLQLYQPKGA